MASKKRSGTITPVSASQPPLSTSYESSTRTSSSTFTSPVSPSKTQRIQEKNELQSLNNRLAAYIDRVRHLEQENSRLVMQVRTSRESVTREVTNIKSMYDHELSDARKLLDETALEKAKLEIDINRIYAEVEDLKTKLAKANKDLVSAENNARLFETRYNDAQQQNVDLTQKYHKALDDAKNLENENARLRRKVAELQKSLEEETLARVDNENKIQSLKEELAFNEGVHQQEVSEMRRSRQVEVSEVDSRIYEEYEARLQNSLQELREQYDARIRANREETEQMYASKIKALENAISRNSTSSASIMEELRSTRITIDGLNKRLKDMENENANLKMRNRDLERILEDERKRHATEREILERELSRLQREMAERMQEFMDLNDIKVGLEFELAAYDKLLKGEEVRLNISGQADGDSPQSSSSVLRASGARTPTRLAAAKRKRVAIDESVELSQSDYSTSSASKGEIEIIEQDSQGRFIKIHNKSNKEVAIGGWQLVRGAGNDETIFKFHRSVKMEPHGHITIWSSDTGANHEPPTNLVMKTQKWVIGENVKTQLLNGNGDEVAIAERVRLSNSSSLSRHRETGGGSGGLMFGQSSTLMSEEMFHQQGDPRPSISENCRMM